MTFSFQYFKYCDEEDSIKCLLCPRLCEFKKNSQVGFCRARIRDGKNLIPYKQNQHTALAVDPIEKKPLYHFFPGEQVLSIGRNFCNLTCSFCQNYHISQSPAGYSETTDEKAVINALKEKTINIVAFTYDEPLMSYESYSNFASFLKNKNFYTVAVTNATIANEFFAPLTNFTDAFNIDLKGPNGEFYKKYCSVNAFENVLINIETAHKESHCEVTYLLIPNANDNAMEFDILMKKLLSITSTSLPLHISAYRPMYKMTNPPTSVEKLVEFHTIAKKYFEYVYIGNVSDKKFNSSFCPKCSNIIVDRSGYESKKLITKSKKCTNCMYSVDKDFIFN